MCLSCVHVVFTDFLPHWLHTSGAQMKHSVNWACLNTVGNIWENLSTKLNKVLSSFRHFTFCSFKTFVRPENNVSPLTCSEVHPSRLCSELTLISPSRNHDPVTPHLAVSSLNVGTIFFPSHCAGERSHQLVTAQDVNVNGRPPRRTLDSHPWLDAFAWWPGKNIVPTRRALWIIWTRQLTISGKKRCNNSNRKTQIKGKTCTFDAEVNCPC